MKLLKTDPQRGMAIVLLAVVMPLSFLFSCGGEKNETIEYVFDPETSHTLKETNVHTLISDSGFTRYKIIAQTWLMYGKASEPFWYFPDGAYLEKFDTLFNIEASAKADTVYYFERRKLWEMIKNVDISNFEGDRFETSHMFWDEKQKTFYSDSFILITNVNGTIQRGYGFTSNENMTIYQIFKPTGDYPYEMRSRAPGDSLAIDSLATDSPAIDSLAVDSITDRVDPSGTPSSGPPPPEAGLATPRTPVAPDQQAASVVSPTSVKPKTSQKTE